MFMQSDTSWKGVIWTPEQAVKILEGRGNDPVALEIRGDAVVETTGTDLVNRIWAIVTVFRDAGVGVGDVVVLHAANGVNWIAAGLGCGWIGAVMAPLDVLVTPHDARDIAEEFGAKIFLTDTVTGTFEGKEFDLAALEGCEAEKPAEGPA